MEKWKEVVGYEGIYMVSSMGRVKRLEHWKNQRTNRSYKHYNYRKLPEKILSASKGDRYNSIQLSKDRVVKTFLVHRIVAEAFLPNPHNLPEVNHKDCDGHNNTIENLEWCDRVYNINYRDRTEKAAKACYKKVKCLDTGVIYNSGKDAALANNLSTSKISAVCHGKRQTTGGLHWCFA